MQWRRLARHWPLAVPLLLAAWLRLYGLLPGSYFGDEAEYVQVARSLAANPTNLAYPDIEGFGPTAFVSQPPLVLYLFALAIRLTGDFATGPLLVTALCGIATVAVVYALGALLHNRGTATTAALLLAILPFHVRASREALLDAPLGLFLALSVLTFVLWTQRPTTPRAVACGIAVAATIFAKLPGILVVPILGIPLLLHAWDNRTRLGAVQAIARHTALALVPTGILLACYLGLLWWLRATADLVAKLGWQAQRVSGEDTLVRPWHWYFAEPDVGLPAQVGWLVLALASAGLAIVASSGMRRQPGRAALLAVALWPVVTLAFFVASARKEWFYVIPVEPALALLAAWPVGLAAQWRPRQTVPARLAPHDAGGRTAMTQAPARAAAAPVGKTVTPAGHAPARPKPVPTHAASDDALPWTTKRTFAVAAVALVASLAAWAPAGAAVQGPGRYGDHVREAALWIHAQDPGAAQVGSTLGRFTLHLYNGQPTYHYWLNHTFVQEGIREGRVRYVVVDAYSSDAGEAQWLQGLVRDHAPVQEYRSGDEVQVRVYRVGP